MSQVQKGTTIYVGFGSFVYTGYVVEDVTVSYPDGNVEVIKGADGSTMTKIFMDPSTKIDCTVLVLTTTGTVDPPIDGATVGIIPPKGTLTSFMSSGSNAKYAPGAARLSLSLLKEGSMSYS